MADRGTSTRRRFLALSAAAATGLAGCTGTSDQENQTTTAQGTTTQSTGGSGVESFQGSGPLAQDRPELSGTRMADLPALSGTLNVYLGGGEGGLYRNLVDRLQKLYPDFDAKVRSAPTAQLANTIVTEAKGGSPNADVFWAVDAGSLGYVADQGVATKLPKRITKPVPKNFHPNDEWVGVAGRARSIPYNTNKFSAKDIPDDIFAFTQQQGLKGAMGWAPTYGAFQSFVTAMRVLNGEKKTKQWLKGMLEQNVTEYPDEFLVSNAVADGELGAGFANHYYALRVKASRPDAPIDLAFTKNDAGSLINVSGAQILQGTENKKLAQNFIAHLLTVEAQEFFATTTFAYPMIPGVPPVGGLPPIDELNPPEFDITKLSNLEPTLRLMREVGVL